GEPETAPDHVEMAVEPDCGVIGAIAQEGEPARVPGHDIEQITMGDEEASPIGSDVDGILDDLDATEMGAVKVAQEFVVIARNIDDAGSLSRLPQDLLHHVIVQLRPIPS